MEQKASEHTTFADRPADAPQRRLVVSGLPIAGMTARPWLEGCISRPTGGDHGHEGSLWDGVARADRAAKGCRVSAGHPD
jgi:hypothetical protein